MGIKNMLIKKCNFCGEEIEWEGSENGNIVWDCDRCNSIFCTNCFISKHGKEKYNDMMQHFEEVLCPKCYELIELLTWDDICDRADDAACLSPELKAKDWARYDVGCLMVDTFGLEDPENEECPEEAIENFCNKHDVLFKDNGVIMAWKE